MQPLSTFLILLAFIYYGVVSGPSSPSRPSRSRFSPSIWENSAETIGAALLILIALADWLSHGENVLIAPIFFSTFGVPFRTLTCHRLVAFFSTLTVGVAEIVTALLRLDHWPFFLLSGVIAIFLALPFLRQSPREVNGPYRQ